MRMACAYLVDILCPNGQAAARMPEAMLMDDLCPADGLCTVDSLCFVDSLCSVDNLCSKTLQDEVKKESGSCLTQ